MRGVRCQSCALSPRAPGPARAHARMQLLGTNPTGAQTPPPRAALIRLRSQVHYPLRRIDAPDGTCGFVNVLGGVPVALSNHGVAHRSDPAPGGPLERSDVLGVSCQAVTARFAK